MLLGILMLLLLQMLLEMLLWMLLWMLLRILMLRMFLWMMLELLLWMLLRMMLEMLWRMMLILLEMLLVLLLVHDGPRGGAGLGVVLVAGVLVVYDGLCPHVVTLACVTAVADSCSCRGVVQHVHRCLGLGSGGRPLLGHTRGPGPPLRLLQTVDGLGALPDAGPGPPQAGGPHLVLHLLGLVLGRGRPQRGGGQGRDVQGRDSCWGRGRGAASGAGLGLGPRPLLPRQTGRHEGRAGVAEVILGSALAVPQQPLQRLGPDNTAPLGRHGVALGGRQHRGLNLGEVRVRGVGSSQHLNALIFLGILLLKVTSRFYI